MEFKSTAVVKYPLEVVWRAMRDQLPEIVSQLDDIQSVTVREREKLSSGNVRIVNIWQAAPTLPAIVAKQIRPEMLAWTDDAEWHQKTRECHWTIVPHYFKERLQCQGVTRFEPALGGRGVKITFSGAIELKTGSLTELSPWLGDMALGVISSFVQKLIPNNFVKLTKALSHFLDLKA